MQATSLLSTELSCWQKFSSSATSTWDTVWERGSILPHAVTWLFFRVLSVFIPGIFAIEILLCHAIAIIQGLRSKSREGDLQEKIKTLEDTQRSLSDENLQMRNAAIQTQVTMDRLIFERDQANGERDISREKESVATEGRAALTYERDQLSGQVLQLQSQFNTIRAQAEAAIRTSFLLYNANLSQAEINQSLSSELEQADAHQILAQQLEKVDQAYKDYRERSGAFITEIEILFPLFEVSKEEYRTMLRTRLSDLSELDPLRFSIEGLLRISEKESTKQLHLSKLYQLFKANQGNS